MSRCGTRLVVWISILSAAVAGLSRPAKATDLHVGTAKVSITPEKRLKITGGLGAGTPFIKKKGDLEVRAIVLRNGETTVAFASLDLLGFPSILSQRVFKQVARIPAENILVSSTHTHSAPDCYAFPDGQGGHTGNLKYMDMVCTKTALAINNAIDNLQPAGIKIATGEAQGKIAYNYYAPQLFDRRMGVMQAVDSKGNTLATLVNFAIHAEVLGPEQGILSPDLVGPFRDKVESQFGGMAMFIAGAQGGMITADNRDLSRPRDSLKAYWHEQRNWSECVRIGETMATEAARIIADAPIERNPSLFCDSVDVRFPVDSDVMWNILRFSPLNYPHDEQDRSFVSRINVVNLGNAQILTIPAEALPNIGFYLKRKMHGQHNFLFGLTNDAFGYMLTKVDYNSFPRYDYVSRTTPGELTGEIYIEQALKLVDRSPRPDEQ